MMGIEKPKFKIGDIIQDTSTKDILEITSIRGDDYIVSVLYDPNYSFISKGDNTKNILFSIHAADYEYPYVLMRGYNTPLWRVLNEL